MEYGAHIPDRYILKCNKTTESRRFYTPEGSYPILYEVSIPHDGLVQKNGIPCFDINDVTSGNDQYIDILSYRVSLLFNNTCLSIYPHPSKVVFEKISEFKLYFTPLMN